MAFVAGGNYILRALDAFSLVPTKFTSGHGFRISQLLRQSFICLRRRLSWYSRETYPDFPATDSKWLMRIEAGG
jgi:hypothetical protein